MAIETDLDFKGKVTANLNEKQTKLLIQDVEIVMCYIDLLPTILKPNPLTPTSGLSFVAQSLLLAFANQHYTTLVRNIMLKGATLADVWPQFIALSLIGLALYTLAIKRLQKKMD